MALPDSQTPRLRSQLPGYTAIVAGHIAEAPGVAYLELARPAKHNCFHEALWQEFPRAVRELDQHEDTRVIVVAAQGANFCAGIDVGYLQRNFLALTGLPGAAAAAAAPGSSRPSDTASGSGSGPASGRQQPQPQQPACPGTQRAAMRRNILGLQDAYSELERAACPVLAAVHGRCIGGGVDLVTACDVRLCSADATFCVKEVDLAIPADLGTLQRLPHIVGHAAAMDLALTARTVGAAEAQRLGLVSSVAGAGAGTGAGAGEAGGGGGRAAVQAAALQLAAAIAAKPRLAVQGTKRVLLHSRDAPRVSDGLDYVATWNSAQLLSADLAAVFSGGSSGSSRGGGGSSRGAAAAAEQQGQQPRSKL
ncbi:hypothetical protein HXX76_008441 [Chlamydomonas incerta]|uniref:Uncharacterized protein n=1 Tax=Chlamydomonas incerta TaxID=51695 RepID=A0A835T6H9_CHLIN|nr:hypothetical protein HXX76_008441 [Chlamydomonas incerta]|eukprot:KAG2433380.1 hypothetical protein HXX76_008441 [Chlamydomonas incerta]